MLCITRASLTAGSFVFIVNICLSVLSVVRGSFIIGVSKSLNITCPTSAELIWLITAVLSQNKQILL